MVQCQKKMVDNSHTEDLSICASSSTEANTKPKEKSARKQIYTYVIIRSLYTYSTQIEQVLENQNETENINWTLLGSAN